jgi:hypothetical protein
MSQEKETFYRKVRCALLFLGKETAEKVNEAIKIAKAREL